MGLIVHGVAAGSDVVDVEDVDPIRREARTTMLEAFDDPARGIVITHIVRRRFDEAVRLRHRRRRWQHLPTFVDTTHSARGRARRKSPSRSTAKPRP